MRYSYSNFSKITNSKDLIKYLTSSDRLNNTTCISHYTSLDSIVNIIKTEYLILNNPLQMNDNLEIEHWQKDKLQKIYFTSFMLKEKENIGMWSMYAQPWEDGVKVSIDTKALKEWLNGIERIYRADIKKKEVFSDEYVNIENSKKPFLACVAYTNNENRNSDNEILYCGDTAKNSLIKDIYSNDDLIGYVKNVAWKYEKEIRLRVEFDIDLGYSAVALKLTDQLISGMTITKGPRFKGDLAEKLKTTINKSIATDQSLFYNKIFNLPCDNCNKKQEGIL